MQENERTRNILICKTIKVKRCRTATHLLKKVQLFFSTVYTSRPYRETFKQLDKSHPMLSPSQYSSQHSGEIQISSELVFFENAVPGNVYTSRGQARFTMHFTCSLRFTWNCCREISYWLKVFSFF